MPGIIDRLAQAFGSQKGDAKQAADTRNELDDAYAQQTELLHQVRRGAAGVAASRRQLATQQSDLVAQIDSLTASAHKLVDQGHDRLAQEALVRKQTLLQQLTCVDAQHELLRREEENLILTATRLQAKIDSIRAKQASVWAQDSAVEASAKAAAALAEIDRGSADDVVQRADALLQAPVAAQQLSTGDLQIAAAEELASIHDQMAARRPAAPGQGSYRQPGGDSSAQIADSTGESSRSITD